ncbi:4a-hydroxytetrahydrobiopterin dehydratase [Nocardioides solisilvae]|uniref:4a-hydroxytetrahydrobiopterin dehydratase n=1 Tax=Nocardioides solisilvae TaxID=1542435 RepID=UPI000D74FA4E|nr:4a-hydroxytetrahydrobiopterin dehydratase [Nocardioides solisilvae]
MGTLTERDVVAAGLPDWRLLQHALHARFLTPDYATGLALVAEVGAVAEEQDHHPDLDLRYGHLDVRTHSHDAGGVTERDLRLARRTSELAAARGARPVPERLSVLELALDTPDRDAVRPFWQAVLAPGDAGAGGADDEVRDDSGRLPVLWFQSSGAEEPRQRFHLDVVVPPEQAGARVEAALAAGGTLVGDDEAPAYVVLADPDGNRVCVCTMRRREG